MKAILCKSLLAVALCMTSVAMAEEAAPSTQPTAKPVNQFCPINKEHKADPTVTHVHKGQTIAFCCGGCVDDFKADPEKYVKDLK